MRLIVGEVARPHGIRGEVVVELHTDEPGQRFRPGVALATEPEPVGPLLVEAARPHQGRLLVTFAGYTDRTQAQALRGVRLWVDAADLPPLADPDEYHDFQLVGLRARDGAGQPLGEVVRVDHGPAADLLVLRLGTGREVLVPFVAAMVPTVDLADGSLVVTAPPGLFDL